MKQQNYVQMFILVVFLFFLFIFILDAQSLKYISYRNPIQFLEPMVDLIPDKIDRPYSLLEGVLPLKEKQTRGNLNSQRCYEGDFQKRLEPTGNYIQRTNNYKHQDAESCSSPFQEFVTAYYEVEPLA